MRSYNPHKDHKNGHGCLVPPRSDGRCYGIAYAFENPERAEAMFRGEISGFMYHGTSDGQEVVRALEEYITVRATDNILAYDTLVSASGMASIGLLYHQLRRTTKKNEIVMSAEVYGGVYNLLSDLMADACGITCRVIENPTDLNAWRTATNDHTIAWHFESISNPQCRALPVGALARSARELGVYSVCDNTVPTFALLRPIVRGVDIEVSSYSKAQDGGSRNLAGAITARKEMMCALRSEWGAGLRPVLCPDAARVLLRSLATLSDRMRRYSRNAASLARVLSEHRGVKRVNYPLGGGASDVDEPMRAGGGLLSAELAGGKRELYDVMRNFRRVLIAPHLGHRQTIAIAPAFTTHWKIPEDVRRRIGIPDSLLRISVGCGDESDFSRDRDDILRALGRIYG